MWGNLRLCPANPGRVRGTPRRPIGWGKRGLGSTPGPLLCSRGAGPPAGKDGGRFEVVEALEELGRARAPGLSTYWIDRTTVRLSATPASRKTSSSVEMASASTSVSRRRAIPSLRSLCSDRSMSAQSSSVA